MFGVLVIIAFLADCGGAVTQESRTQLVQEEVIKPLDCPDGRKFSREKGYCISICRYGEKWDPVKKACVSKCKPGYTWWHGMCQSRCKQGQVWNEELYACECPNGKVFHQGIGACLTESEWAKANERLEKLEKSCPPGTVLTRNFGGQIVGCVSRCWGGDQRWDEEAQQCVSSCPSGTKYDIITEQCISICGRGTWNPKQRKCECPSGQTWSRIFGCR